MSNARTRILIVSAVIPMLGGCKAIFGESLFGLHRQSKPDIEQASLMPADAATQEGRQQLAAGNPGLAIAAFQRALATGETIAPAANGLGVAYARVDRPDLARRFFEQAIASAPGDPKYVANLDRLIAANQLAFAYREAEVSARQAAVSPPAVQTGVPTSAEKQVVHREVAVEGAMRRVSRAEVMITTAPSSSATRLGRRVEPRSDFVPLVRLEIGRDKIADFRPVVRIRLPASEPPRGDSSGAAAKMSGEAS